MGTISSLVVMDGPKTVVANWKTQFAVTYEEVGVSLVETSDVFEWVDVGTPVKGDFEKVRVDPSANVRHVLVSESEAVSVDGPLTLRAVYQTQYLVTFSQDGMGSGVSGTVEIVVNGNRSVEELPVSIWVNAGDLVSFCYQASVESTEGERRYVLKEGNSSSTLTIDEPMIVHGYYLPESVSSGFGVEIYVIAVLLVSVPASVAVPVVVRRRRGGCKIIRPVVSNGGMISPIAQFS